MYALPIGSACPGDDSNDAEETPQRRPEAPRPSVQDCSNFDIVQATQYGALERVTELLDAGDDVNQPDSEGITLLHWAAINNRGEIVKYLIARGANLDAIGGKLASTPLLWAARQGHLAAFTLLMRAGADPTLRDSEGYACIHVAAQFGRTGIVAYLIGKGVDPNDLDRSAMTPLMWSSYKVNSLDPTRLLLNLGASHSLTDIIHGNTALHWAIIARNNTAIYTLVRHGASLDVPNFQNETPMTLLGPHVGAAWLGPKISHEIKSRSGRSREWSKDKRIRWYSMASTPFIVFYLTGMIFQSNLDYLIKLCAFLILYLALYLAKSFLFDERLYHILPISLYLSTKMWIYITWIFWLGVHAAWYLWLLLVIGSVPLWICFLQSWRGDPGIISATHEDKLNTIVELAEGGGFETQWFCTSCLVRRPIRSKHCSTCDRCVARFDHHCPWINNCIGAHNHKYFLGFLVSLLGLCIVILLATVQYWQFECWSNLTNDHHADNYFISATCDSWVMWIAANTGIHALWIGFLLACQLYQIMVLGMTTNERMNAGRYEHFKHGNPFHRGAMQNLADFCNFDFCGVRGKPSTDWLNSFDIKESVEQLPLLNAEESVHFWDSIMNCNEEYKLLQSDKESRLNNPTPTRGKASSDYLDAEYTTCMSSEPSLDDHGTNEQLPSKNYGRPRTYRMTMNREPNEHLCHTTASNIAHVVSGTLGSSAPPPILPTFYWSKLRRSRGRSIQKSHNYKKLGVGTRTNFAHSTKLFQQNALRAGVPSGEKIMFKDSDTKPLDNEKKEIPVNGKRMRSNELGISMINVNMPPGEVDIYFFDHGTSGYYSTTDIAPILLSHKCVDKIDNAATRFWAEIFGTIHIGMTFVTAFILQLLRFILRSILRPLIVGIIQMIADYAFKPILTIIFNGIIQPIFIFLYNITTSFRDVCEPIAKAIGYFFREFANLFRAIRLIEINPQSATDNNYHHRIIAPT